MVHKKKGSQKNSFGKNKVLVKQISFTPKNFAQQKKVLQKKKQQSFVQKIFCNKNHVCKKQN